MTSYALARTRTGSTPIIRSVSSVIFGIGGAEPFERAVRVAGAWMRKRNPAVPANVGEGRPFDVGGNGTPVARAVTLAFEEGRIREWSLSDLASIAIMSRSVFAERFAAAIGIPPLRYAKRWRLALAEEMLRTGSHKVGEVSRHIGYASETSEFSDDSVTASAAVKNLLLYGLSAYQCRRQWPLTLALPAPVLSGRDIHNATECMA